MADTIRVNTDLLLKCSNALKSVAQGFGDAASILSQLDTSQEWWSKMGRFSDLRLQDEGSSADLGDAGAAVRTLAGIMRRYDRRATKLSVSVARTADMFDSLENQLASRVNGQDAGTEGNIIGTGAGAGDVAVSGDNAPLSREERLREEEDQLVDMIERQISNDYLKQWFDSLKIYKIVLAGKIYDIIQLNGEDFLLEDLTTSVTMLDGLLDRYSSRNYGIIDDLKDLTKTAEGHLSRSDSATNGVISLGTKGGSADKFNALSKKLDIISKTSKGAVAVSNVYERYNKLMNMDPETAKDLARGLRESGDRRAAIVAKGLESVGDPVACLEYCMATEGIDCSKELIADKVRDFVSTTAYGSPYMPIQASKDISTFATEGAFNTSDTIGAATYADNVAQMRNNTYKALNHAIKEYHSNPCSANADKVTNLYKAYNAQSVEQINAVKKISESTDRSVVGIFGNQSARKEAQQSMDRFADTVANSGNYVNYAEQRIQALRK